ncbi:MAG: phosphate ABC transporter permease PstA [Sulfobacillus sp.]
MRDRASQRRWMDRAMRALCYLAAVVAVFPLVDILYQIGSRAIPSMGSYLFTQPVQGNAGGLENAILGTLLLVSLGIAIAAPLGIFGGIYLAEFGRTGPFGQAVRFTTDVLAGVPSIVIGYFGYVTLVVGLGWKFSALAGAIALAMMALPYIMRATELAFRSLPDDLREASLALGAGEVTTVFRVLWRPAMPGLITGVLLAVSIGLGETAPLIYTAGWSVFLPTGQLIGSPVGYLTYVIWTFINNPFAASHALAYAAAFLLILFILVVNVVVRRLVGRLNPGMQRGG